MLRVYLPNDSKMGIGGGFTFRRNLASAAGDLFEVVTGGQWDVALVCGATMVTRATWRALMEAPGPVILRVDGIPEDWRNRGTGWPRLRDFAREADAVVYQSNFVKATVGRLLGREGGVIYNGVDTSIFNPGGERMARFGSPSILCVNYRKDVNKRIDEVVTRFRYYKLDHPGAALTFAGVFPTYLREWSFGMLDYARDRDWRYLGVVHEPADMAAVMRSHDHIAFPSFADPCPNTLVEALACGCRPLWVCDYGGASEIVERWSEGVDCSIEKMGQEYLELFREVVG